MSLKLKFTYQKLEAINVVWQDLDKYCPKTVKEKAMISQMRDLAIKFQKKQLLLRYKYNPTSEYTISLKAYEAYFFEQYLRDIMPIIQFGYERTIISKTADFINQKLA